LIKRLFASVRRKNTLFWEMREKIFSRGGASKAPDPSDALREAMQWLRRAQDACSGGGVSTGYDLRAGWLDPFPETTGYIAPTFFNYARLTGDSSYSGRAVAMLNWLKQEQNQDGSIQAVMRGHERPVIFDTGQVLFGFLRGFIETRDEAYLDCARKCGDWLKSMQDPDGKWSKYEFMDQIHVYNTRVAWALSELGRVTGHPAYSDAAAANIEWAVTHQHENGWYDHNAFSAEQPTYTHTIAYATRGILESAIIHDRREWIRHAERAADSLLSRQSPDGALSGSYDPEWNPTTDSMCLTGNAQMAIIWLRLFQLTREEKYMTGASKAVSCLLSKQERSICFRSIRGAVAGSWPINGNYLPYVYPNWAAKFFSDLLMLNQSLGNQDRDLLFY
jgi:uncharacterized protein YyaL (SSP411 family)